MKHEVRRHKIEGEINLFLLRGTETVGGEVSFTFALFRFSFIFRAVIRFPPLIVNSSLMDLRRINNSTTYETCTETLRRPRAGRDRNGPGRPSRGASIIILYPCAWRTLRGFRRLNKFRGSSSDKVIHLPGDPVLIKMHRIPKQDFIDVWWHSSTQLYTRDAYTSRKDTYCQFSPSCAGRRIWILFWSSAKPAHFYNNFISYLTDCTLYFLPAP